MRPGAADDGLFARDDGRQAAVRRQRAGALASALAAGCRAASGRRGRRCRDGRKARPGVPADGRALSRSTATRRRAVAERCGIPAATIRRIAAELADAAFEQAIEIRGRRGPTGPGGITTRCIGRPVSMHAMRGISAHSNGFQTCRAMHLLQMLLGTIDVPGRLPLQVAVPEVRAAAGQARRRRRRAEQAAARRAARLPDRARGPAGRPDGTPHRIDKAFSLGSAARRARHDAHGDPQRLGRRSLPDRHAVHLHGQHGVELGDERAGRHAHADRQGRGDRRIQDPAHHLFRCLLIPRWWPTPTWCCPTRPISSAGTASRCSTGRSAMPTAPADAIRQPVVQPDRDVRPFQDVLIDLGARLELPGWSTADGKPRYPGGYPDYIVRHERRPGIGPLAGWRGARGRQAGHGRAEPRPARPLHRERLLLARRDAGEGALLPLRQPRLSRLGDPARASSTSREPIVLQLYSEPLQQVPARGRRAWRGPAAGAAARAHRARLRSAADLVPAVRGRADRQRTAIRCTRSRSGRCRCIIPGARRTPGCGRSWRAIRSSSRASWASALGLADDDWVWVESPHGRVKAQIKLMDGVNPDTVWTWNAIGKRAAPGTSPPTAPESTQGLPAQPPDLRTAAAAAGRASLRQCRSGDRPGGLVRPARAPDANARRTKPARPRRSFASLAARRSPKPAGDLAYGAEFRARWREATP